MLDHAGSTCLLNGTRTPHVHGMSHLEGIYAIVSSRKLAE